MKTRLQLAKGYTEGTLTKGELRYAESSSLVMNEVRRLTKTQKIDLIPSPEFINKMIVK